MPSLATRVIGEMLSPMRSLSFRRRGDNIPQRSACSPACGSTQNCTATAASCSPATPAAASSSVERWSSPESVSTRLRRFDAANKAPVQERSTRVYQERRLVRTDDLKAADLSLWLQHCRRENGLHKEHLEAISRRMYRDGLARKGETLNAADMGSWFEHIQRENRLHKEHLEAISRRMHRDGLMTRSELERWLEGPEENLAVLSPAARSLLKQRQARTSPHERRSRTDSPYELRRDETAGAVLGAASELRRDETAGAVLGAVSPYAATATDFPPAWVASSPGGPAGLIVIASAPGHPPGHVAQLNAQLVGSISPRMPWFLPVQSPLPREAEADLTTPKPRRPAPAETVAFTASAPALTRASTPAALARARASTPASAMTPSRSRGETTVYYL